MKATPHPNELERAVSADVDALAAILDRRQSEIVRLRAHVPSLVVTIDTARSVLGRLQQGTISPAQAQRWASFVRRGYVEGHSGGPVQPIAIEFEPAAEDEIAEIVSRLDEIGDLIDGNLTSEEIEAMRRNLLRAEAAMPVSPT
jgi:hypothetical protein